MTMSQSQTTDVMARMPARAASSGVSAESQQELGEIAGHFA